MSKKLLEVHDFIVDNTDSLIDHVQEDLKLRNCDKELSELHDNVDGAVYMVSLEDIIRATRDRILTAIESFSGDK